MHILKRLYTITILGLFICLLFIHQHSAAQFQQSQFQQPNQSQQGSYGSNTQNNSSYNQQNGGNSSQFGQSSRSSGRLSGRSTSSRSSRRNNGTDSTLNPNGAPSQYQSNRPSASPRSLSPSNSAPSSNQNSGSEIVIHSGNVNEGKNSASPRASVPKPRFASKTFLYLESSHLSVKVGEPFTVDVRLSGKTESKYDQLAFTLSYDPKVLMPVLDQNVDGNWIAAQQMEMIDNDNQKSMSVVQNQIHQQDGLIHLKLNFMEPQPAKMATISRLVFVPVLKQKSTRIEFVSKSDEPNIAMSYLRMGDEDVLGSAADLFDGVIPLDVFIQDAGSTSNTINSSNRDDSNSRYQSATLDLVLTEKHVDVGGNVTLDVVLNNPAQIPVDEVEFLIVYNTRVLQLFSQNALSANGLDVNAEKGILRFKGAMRKTNAAQHTTIATIQFKAVAPTTKSTFKVLVHKGGTMASTGAYYKGHDILGDPAILTDGVRTTSISVRPTLSYLNQMK